MATHKIQPGDNFKKIAQLYYNGDGALWPNIQAANPGVDPNNLPIGQTIHIPDSPDPSKRNGGNSTRL
ncbi:MULTISPECIES: LysM domain-containing protein [unclassified Microcoleus]|uniref:LysM domain-containing protein n=1 Tax=unclassified Microcoleus TaxID=2642155 RepID=UPI002FD4BB30